MSIPDLAEKLDEITLETTPLIEAVLVGSSSMVNALLDAGRTNYIHLRFNLRIDNRLGGMACVDDFAVYWCIRDCLIPSYDLYVYCIS